jgi:hypothetical protein
MSRVLAGVLVVFAACGDAGAPACDETTPATALATGEVVGSIALIRDDALFDGDRGPERMATVSGHAVFSDRPIHALGYRTGLFVGWQTEVAAAGECRRLEYQPVVCDPGCFGGAVCVEPGMCVPAVEPRFAGPLAFDVGATHLTMRYDDGLGYRYLEQDPDPDVIEPCADVIARADGDEVPAVTLTAPAVAPLADSVVGLSLVLEDDRDVTLSWQAWDAERARVRVQLVSPNRGHGTPVAAIIECDVADTGSVTVPGELIGALPPSHDEYCAGYDCPDSEILRYHRRTVDTAAGVVELVTGSALGFRIVHNPELAP